ncbi:MAG: sorbosone dehydrogenase family protein, partial [Candidatus Binatia bacterium]
MPKAQVLLEACPCASLSGLGRPQGLGERKPVHGARRFEWVATVIVLLLHLTLPVEAQVAIDDPVPDRIVKSGLSVKIVDFVQVPASSSSPPLARINLLYHSRDNTGALFVNDLRGKLYVIDRGIVTTYLDLASLHPNFVDTPRLGTGFGCFAFHPDFATNGIFYTVHSEDPGFAPPDLGSTSTVGPVVHSVIKEWTVDDPVANVFTGTVREILRIAQPSFIHAVQQIGFNPNANPGDADYGMLYIAQGDGEEEPFTDNPQNLSSPHGAILRIDPLGINSPNGAYGIPADNPFANDGDSNTLGEIWAYGFRNPHRFSWDTGGDGKMLIGEIGEHNVEEVNLGKVGANYGWNEREGTFQFDKNNPSVVFQIGRA